MRPSTANCAFCKTTASLTVLRPAPQDQPCPFPVGWPHVMVRQALPGGPEGQRDHSKGRHPQSSQGVQRLCHWLQSVCDWGRGSENGVSKDVWVYDTLQEEWSKAAPMLIARFGHGSAELRHCLYVVGGHTAATGCLPASPSVSLKQVEQFDPVANKWSMVAPLREGVSNAAVVSVKLKLFAFGGTSVAHDKLPKVQCYDPSENRWTVPASCPQPWRYTAAAVLGNQIFVMGGDTEFSACSAYKFSSETYQWTKVGDVTAKRMSCQAVASGNKLYVVGGYFGTQRCKTLDCYDPTLDAWNSITTVPYSLIPTAFVSTWKHPPAWSTPVLPCVTLLFLRGRSCNLKKKLPGLVGM